MKTFFLPVLLSSFFFIVEAQQKSDSTKEKSIARRAFHTGAKLISTSQKDTVVNELGTDAFKEHENKIIRNIFVEFIGFEHSIYDSTKQVNRIITKAADALHSSTKEITIRNNLFIRKNEPLNPYLLSDNERYLRDLDFILDSRIVPTPIAGSDSVDLTIITRDVFSLGVRAGGSLTAPEFSIYDANVAGRGQRVEFSGLIEGSRSPAFGYSVNYRKRSAWGSFVNLELGYTQLNTGSGYGDEDEYAYFIKISRPLVSPYSRLAGGLEISNNWSVNIYNEPDSSFLDYNYKIFDTWIGYNLGIKNPFENRNRYFLALRYMDGYFVDSPDQEDYQEERDYNSVKGVLSEFTFYRKNFFKTRYIFGFGRTEDVPYGLTMAITSGYVRQLNLYRPYAALKFNYGQASKKGNFYILKLQAGSYFHNSKAEDLLVNASATYYTRALNFRRNKIRALISTGYAQLFNQSPDNFLEFRKSEIRGISADTLKGTQRFSARFETTLYSPLSLLGFRFAPFAGLDWANLNCSNCEGQRPNIFGINAGLRTRNENLIFGTMELRMIYIPDDGTGNNQFKVEFKQNLRVKNSGNFAEKPKLVSN